MSGCVPAGWALVPVEPTREMLLAGGVEVAGVQCPIEPYIADAGNAWTAMLAAAPTPPSRDADVERVARALCVSDGADPDGLIAFVKAGHKVSVCEWMRYLKYARAALQALGERG